MGPGPEFELIRSFFEGHGRAERPDVRVGPGDDCAVVAGDGIVLTIDLSIEGVHFRRDWLTPFQIGFRVATASLSDLAAMAARPIGVLISLGLPERDAGEYAADVMRGATTAVERAGGVVLGGDVTRSLGPVIVDAAAVGETNRPILRSGAMVGDAVWVTGELGGAGAAVAALERGEKPNRTAFQAYSEPVARTAESRWLAERGLQTAMLDLSDGLGGDAGHIAAASGVTIVLEVLRLPIHEGAAALGDQEGIRLALSGGEDYELCFSARAGVMEPLVSEFESEFSVRLTRVGQVESGHGVLLQNANGTRSRLETGGFQHFGDVGG